MPLAKFFTNSELSPQQKTELHESAAKIVAECLGKSISVCMVVVECGVSMSLGGDRSACALVEVSGIELIKGGAKVEELTQQLGGRVAVLIGVPPERVFVKFADVERGMWGNGAKIFY